MDYREAGLLAAVVAGGLGLGWMTGGDSAAPASSVATSGQADGSAPTPAQFGSPLAPAAAATTPPTASRTSEGEQLDAQVRARAQAAFEAARRQTEPPDAASAAVAANAPASSGATGSVSTGSWSGQSAATGGGWGGQGTSSGGGWGVQAGIAPSSGTPGPTPTPASSSASSSPAQEPAD